MTYNESIDTYIKILAEKVESLRKLLININDTMQRLHSSTISTINKVNEIESNIQGLFSKIDNEITNLKTKIEEQNRIQSELFSKVGKEIKELRNEIIERSEAQKTFIQGLFSKIDNEITNLKTKIEEQNRIQSELLLSDVALQLFYIYMDLYSSAWIELHRVDLHYMIVVDNDDSILLAIVTNSASDDVEKLLKNIANVLEKTLDKKVVYRVFAPTQLIDSRSISEV
ncbi:MAG: hypothetical protein QXD57_07305 [Ignisphaera sp.]